MHKKDRYLLIIMLAMMSVIGLMSSDIYLPAFTFYLSYTIIACSAYGAYFAYLAVSSSIFNKLNFKPDWVGFFYISVALTYISGNLLAKKLTKTIIIDKALLIGIIPFTIGGLIMLILSLDGITNPLEIIIPMSILTFGNGFLLPLGVAGAVSVFPNLAGTASGFMGLLQLGAASLAAMITGYISSEEVFFMALIIFITNIIGGLALLIVHLIKINDQRTIKIALFTDK